MCDTITLTFGDCAENHKGMQKIGNTDDSKGFSNGELKKYKKFFEDKGYKTKLIKLNKLIDEEDADKATLLIVKNGIECFVDKKELYDEINNTKKDTKAYMYGRVVNKKARYNNCFSDFSQEANYEEKKGTIINFKDVENLQKLRNNLCDLTERKELQCEGNYYYDVNKTFIGFHGDSERKIVIGCRLGKSFNIYFQWYYKGEKQGKLLKKKLRNGDIYFMSKKAVGTDWKTKNEFTLRHAAAKNEDLIL